MLTHYCMWINDFSKWYYSLDMIYVKLFVVPSTGLEKSDVDRVQTLITSTTEMIWCTRIQLAYKIPQLIALPLSP